MIYLYNILCLHFSMMIHIFLMHSDAIYRKETATTTTTKKQHPPVCKNVSFRPNKFDLATMTVSEPNLIFLLKKTDQ